MSYNLMAEGDLDFFELSRAAHDYSALELFPIPAEDVDPGASALESALAPEALGIAIASSRVSPAALSTLRALIQLLWERDVSVFDLCAGERISTEEDLAALDARIRA